MTALARVLRRLRGPWVAPDPAPDWWGPACTCTTHAALRARDALHATLRAEGTRYDAEWPDVLAAEALGGDLAAMAAPGDWPEFSGWGEGYEIEPETAYMARHVMSDVAPVWVSWVAHRDARARAVGDMVHDLTTAMHAGSHLAITPTGCHLVGPLAHPPTPPVDEADVEALAGLVDEAGVRVVANASSRLIARRLLATGRVAVPR